MTTGATVYLSSRKALAWGFGTEKSAQELEENFEKQYALGIEGAQKNSEGLSTLQNVSLKNQQEFDALRKLLERLGHESKLMDCNAVPLSR